MGAQAVVGAASGGNRGPRRRFRKQHGTAAREITFRELVDKWDALVPGNMYKPSTWMNYRSHLLRHLIPAFGASLLNDIHTEALQQFVSAKTLETGPKTTRNILMTLRVLWKSARAWGYVTHNPFDGLMLPRVVRSERPTFTLDEVRRIIAESPGDYKLFFWLAAETGMRAGELAGLRREDVNVEAGVLHVRQSVWGGRVQTPKTVNSIRTCAISPELAEALRMYLVSWRGNRLQLLFSNPTGTPWNCGRIARRVLAPILVRLGIKHGGLHAFRHAAATMADQHALPLRDRQKRLGHADARVTLDVYTHTSNGVSGVSESERVFVSLIGRELAR